MRIAPSSAFPACKEKQEGLEIRVRLKPGASANEICGFKEGQLQVRLRARPVDGAANKALLIYLGQVLDCAPSSVILLKGKTGRDKVVFVVDMSLQHATERLKMAESPP